MRILDKNTDFYDYLQNVYYDPSVTFDRTDSFELTKEIFCNHLYAYDYMRFSLKKQALERTASKDITDTEKLENHGFDRKKSFRGKAKTK